jgi:hypothetical protein
MESRGPRLGSSSITGAEEAKPMLDADRPIAITPALTVSLAPDLDGTRSTILGNTGDREIGIWEVDPGVTTDIEVDEVFIVLNGSATISVDGHVDVNIGPGDVVHLTEGTHTTWKVHERLRKVYLIAVDEK